MTFGDVALAETLLPRRPLITKSEARFTTKLSLALGFRSRFTYHIWDQQKKLQRY